MSLSLCWMRVLNAVLSGSGGEVENNCHRSRRHAEATTGRGCYCYCYNQIKCAFLYRTYNVSNVLK